MAITLLRMNLLMPRGISGRCDHLPSWLAPKQRHTYAEWGLRSGFFVTETELLGSRSLSCTHFPGRTQGYCFPDALMPQPPFYSHLIPPPPIPLPGTGSLPCHVLLLPCSQLDSTSPSSDFIPRKTDLNSRGGKKTQLLKIPGQYVKRPTYS